MTAQLSPEAAAWLARRSMILDYLNEQQPADQQHNRRIAADLTHLMQRWMTPPGEIRCTCGHDRDAHGRRDAQTAWRATCYGDADCGCDDFTEAPL